MTSMELKRLPKTEIIRRLVLENVMSIEEATSELFKNNIMAKADCSEAISVLRLRELGF